MEWLNTPSILLIAGLGWNMGQIWAYARHGKHQVTLILTPLGLMQIMMVGVFIVIPKELGMFWTHFWIGGGCLVISYFLVRKITRKINRKLKRKRRLIPTHPLQPKSET